MSAPNAKFEFHAGALSLPAPVFVARAAGTVTVPIGEHFGLQADLSASTAPGFITTAALHFFARDPAAYLIGGTLGFVRSPGATVLAAGPEAELYFDRWTLEAWGGIGAALPASPSAPSRVGPFVMTSAGYYVTDDFRLSLGLSWLDGYGTVQFGSEYLIGSSQLPLALTTEIRVGQDGAARFTAGLRLYAGPDPTKSLILRHREDDPADRSAALYGAVGGRTLGTGTARSAYGGEASPDPEPEPETCPENPGGYCF